MKLIIQLPCYNEEKTLGTTLSALPRKVPGVDTVEWLVIDDGSTDRTAEVAKEYGADFIVSHQKNKGLAKAFMSGLHACIENGADIIVNTDADNQYSADCIPELIKPIIEKKADMVIGARPISETKHFSRIKKYLQKLGSWVVRIASNTDIPDASSGFRAFSRDSAKRINVYNNYTYTLESIIQAGQKNMSVTWIPVQTNAVLRPSRLIKSIPFYVFMSTSIIIRIFVVYKPFRFFMSVGLTLFIIGVFIGIRFLYFYFIGEGRGHVQSLILSSILIGIGFQTMMTAFIADLISVNRRLLEEVKFREPSYGTNAENQKDS